MLRPTVSHWSARLGQVALCLLAVLPACFDPAVATTDTETSSAVADFDVGQVDAAEELAPDTVLGPIDTVEVKQDPGSDVGLDYVVSTRCPGAASCTCIENKDCDAGLCIETPAGRQCAVTCFNSCKADYRCAAVPLGTGGDILNICVPKAGRACNPCTASKECAAVGIASPVCVDQGAAGSFCGTDCLVDPDCASGYQCKAVTSVEGVASKQCVRLPDAATPEVAGVCGCSAYAVAQKLKTSCGVVSKDGSGKITATCKGERLCLASGLTTCNAPAATAELCNAKDDDCDGATDEAACDDTNACTLDVCDPTLPADKACSHSNSTGGCDADSSACTENDACSAGKCVAGPAKKCNDGNPCTKDSCSPSAGCVQAPDDGAPCDDDNACTIGDACQTGKCQSGPAKTCGSSDPCVDGKCSLVDGKCKFSDKPDGLSCDDGTVCTKSDACKAGTCTGTVASCDDGVACTDDSCNAAAGCLHANNNLPCSDGNDCTVGDACTGGLCKAGLAKLCDDGNPCTADVCATKTGACTFEPTTAACNDNDACTAGDVCAAGACKPGATKDCNDSNPCTTDTCDAVGACQSSNGAGSCDDGNPCSIGDSCSGGACKPGSAKVCADSDTCTADACDAKTGQCTFVKIIGCGGNCQAAGDCDDSNPCTVNACQSSKCAFVPSSEPCDDGNGCSVGDLCSGGACKPGAGKSCDDGNPCTDDGCDTKSGACTNTANKAPCSDLNACTGPDVCAGGACKGGGAKPCDDNNPCTTDGCDGTSGNCVAVANNKGCDDANPCTVNDSCVASACQGGQAKPCSDSNPCTDDSCDATTGQCTTKPNTQSCDDGNACSQGDLCGNGQCKAGALKNCDDANPCTDDSCNPGSGACAQVANKGGCTDGNACTANDACANAQCVPGAAKDCNDSDACTADSCNPTTGNCVQAPIVGCGGNCAKPADCDDKNVCTDNLCTSGKCQFAANNVPCADGNACTLSDNCTGGACKGGPAKVCDDKKPCTQDGCDVASGVCQNTASSDPCDDGSACTVNDGCSGGACKPGKAVVCDDGNPCTSDSCDPATGKCGATANTAACSDGNACTLSDTCADGACKPGTAKDCNDSNPCTNDACDPATAACSNVANLDPCSDGNACTIGDSCAAKACKSGAAKSCDDNNVCTSDACNTGNGTCSNAANTLGCNDNNPCTLGDGCSGGLCKAGTAKACSDSDNCTSDGCDPGTGNCVFTPIVGCGGNCAKAGDCVDGNPCTDDTCATGKCAFPANTASCSDGNACTLSDGCAAGVCKAGALKDCNDSNPCTNDSCDTATGTCKAVNNNAACSDGDGCTLNDQCGGGVCLGGAVKVCNDSNPCTDDSCSNGTCTNAANTATCSDANACTSGDQCKSGLCNPGGAITCDDGNVCTGDSCSKTTGCVFSPLSGACNDGNACTTGDTCGATSCVGGPAPNCDDLSVCTIDACDSKTGCTHTPIANIAKDCGAIFDAKSGGDGIYCIDPDGAGGEAPVQTLCDITGGGWTLMIHRAKNSDSACNIATVKSYGLITSTTAPTDGKFNDTVIQQFPNPVYRFDGGWTGGPIRQYWQIQAPWNSVWYPQNPQYRCTINQTDWPATWSTTPTSVYPLGNTTCKGASYSTIWWHIGQDGCAYIGDPGGWAWRNLDNTAPSVLNFWIRTGGCKLATECDDKNACTDDTCDGASSTCKFTANTATCSDGNACTLNDICAASACKPGAAKSCDDSNPCTTDSCATATGVCSNTNNTAACSDGNACTVGDVCASGACKAGTTKVCDDSSICTDDSCDAATGNCVYKPSSVAGLPVVTTGLMVHLDASDAASYGGSGQVWKDLSGNGNDFNLGSTASADPADPTFAAGAFTMTGSAFFTKAGSNGAFINSIHKVGAKFTVEVWHAPAGSGYYIALGTSNNVATTGFRWFLEGALGGFHVHNAPAQSTVFSSPYTNLLVGGVTQAVAVAVDSTAGSGFTWRSGATVGAVFPVVYTNPGVADALNLLRLGTQTNDGAPIVPAGSKFMVVRMYNRALGKAELDQNWCAQKGKFGL